MKTNIVVLILGIISVIASTEELNQKNNPLAVNEPQQIIEYTTIVSRQDDQENINTESEITNEITEKYDNAEIDIIIEESIEGAPNDFVIPEAPIEDSTNELILPEVPTPLEGTPNQFIVPEPPTTLIYEDGVQEPQIYNPYAQDNVIIKEPGEIMETAEGFVPIPIIRNRQKQRRRFITRRNFQRYPFRRFHFFYPYPFYHPSSLRYYRF